MCIIDEKSAQILICTSPHLASPRLAHNDGAYKGHAVYTVLDAQKGKTLHQLLVAGSSVVWTGTSTSRDGGVGSNGRARNAGDGFVDHGFAIAVNSDYKGCSAQANHHRLGPHNWQTSAVDSTVNCNGHNFGGWGGKHYNGGWGSLYEGAALNGYCSSQGCFGNNNQVHPSAPSNNACSSCSPSGHDVDMAVFVR